jgi:uncharacterized protein with NAD-binding domain and iron-sulfur cluster
MIGNGSDKTRVAILGGGMSALTAAFELTEHDPDGSNYDITIYTLGWRLGGKASVGRDVSRHDRAYEHGLHIWAGFYDNAFDVVKRLYAGLGADPDAWKSCFAPLNHFTVMETDGVTWKPWLMEFPPNDLERGIGRMPSLAPWSLLVELLTTVTSAFHQSELPAYLGPEAHEAARARLAAIVPLARPPVQGEPILSVTGEAVQRLPPDPSQIGAEQRTALDRLIVASRDQVAEAIAAAPQTDDTRRLRILYDLAFAMARGLLSDEVLFGGFEAIDDIEWRDWMSNHGCDPVSLQSAVVRGCYDYAFVPEGKGIGAGTATLLGLRFVLAYKGSVLHALTEPMGDNIIAPFYRCLKKRGVKFEFFCRVKKLELSTSEPAVDRVVLAQQVLLANSAEEYKPLVARHDGRPSWPSEPDPTQIVDGNDLKGFDLESAWTAWQDAIPERVLRRRTPDREADEEDMFDIIVLAMGFDGLKTACVDLRERLPELWGNFLDRIESAQTAALQLWLIPDTGALGWPDPDTALTAFEEPGDSWQVAPLPSWENNTRLIHLERPRKNAPRSLAYFCGTFPDARPIPRPGSDPDFPEREKRRAGAAFKRWMNNRLGVLWPNAVAGTPLRFRWDLLEAPANAHGARRLDHQFFKVNIDPSERYVLSVPCSTQYRLRPDGSGINNLYLAGDWVRSGVNAGCIEAAVIAGRMTARAITEADMTIPGDSNSDLFPLPITALPLVNVIDKLKTLVAGGLGSIDAYCATIPVPIDEVKKRLAPGLRLIPPAQWTEDFHPVMLVFSRHRHVRPGFMPAGGINYLEFAELIPYVDRDDTYAPAGGPFTYMPYLLLDQPLAVALGVNGYGFNKRLARLSAHDGAFVVTSDLSVIRAKFHTVGLPGTFDKLSSIDSCRRFLGQPFISRKSTGEWVYSYLDYQLESATYQRIHGEIAIGKPFLPVAETFSTEQFALTHMMKKIAWFHFSSRWRLSMPLTAGQVSDTSAPAQIRSTVSQWTGGRFRSFFRG